MLNHFIKATEEYNTFEAHVPAHYFRRTFTAKGGEATLRVAVCGFYKLYLNGEHLTRGHLSPYIANSDDCIYYDEYKITLLEGENVVALILGNGFQNNPGGHIWKFDLSPFRSAPLLSLELTQNDDKILVSDASFKVAPSPIRFDDYRFGEHYDANFEIEGWNALGFDDTVWKNALTATAPKGELRKADVAPILTEKELSPVAITRYEDGYLYDFGESNAGVCRLKVNGKAGQTIVLQHADAENDGELDIKQIWFPREHWERDKEIVHKDFYTCKGGPAEYTPSFVYHGFRYVKVYGITPEQATEDLLTFVVFHTELHSRGDFTCSDPIATKLQEMTRRSIVSNFHHFPTDCPQREKNGWTADAALTTEAALLNFDPDQNYREWHYNICKAQRKDGALPGVIPTGGWGFNWGNGPAWDCVLVTLPYFVYLYRGKTDMIDMSADAMVKYLKYLRTRCDEKGLLAIGLGDWCQVGHSSHGIETPLIVTDTIMAKDIADKSAFMLSAIGREEDAAFAREQSARYRADFRAHLLDLDSATVSGETQSGQAMALYYGLLEQSEEQKAFDKLLSLIHDKDDHMGVGVLGGRVIFHVLTKFGYSELALKMIVREDYPSYGNWIKRGATTLWENFLPDRVDSKNHHFWGDISAWFIKRIVGICLNPDGHDVNCVCIAPHFLTTLDHASAHHIAPAGKIEVSWKRTADGIELCIDTPAEMETRLELPCGCTITEQKGNTYYIKEN